MRNRLLKKCLIPVKISPNPIYKPSKPLAMKRLLLILLITPFLFGNSAFATKVKFFKGSFVSAKQKAASEGKLIFVDFTARWCLPCQMMDQTTFNDELLADYLASSYVPVKVDIDDFDGFALKEQYEIQALPSILIFNSAGELLDRHQEAMGATKMKEMLIRYDHPDNKKISAVPTHQGEYSQVDSTPSAEPTPTTSAPSRPPLPTTAPTSPAPYTPSPQPQPTYPEPEPMVESTPIIRDPVPAPAPTYESVPAPTYEPTPAPTPVVAPEVMPAGEGLFRFTVSRQASAGFSVQIGAFGHYGNVLTEVEKIQSKINEPVLVNIATLRGKTVYKVLVGEFMSRQEAVDFSNYLKGIQIEGIIKDLTLLK